MTLRSPLLSAMVHPKHLMNYDIEDVYLKNTRINRISELSSLFAVVGPPPHVLGPNTVQCSYQQYWCTHCL
jgi:hypothetical protein